LSVLIHTNAGDLDQILSGRTDAGDPGINSGMRFEQRIVGVKNALAPESGRIPDIHALFGEIEVNRFIRFSGNKDVVITGRFETGPKIPSTVGIVDRSG
jgi:hypothetical protein